MESPQRIKGINGPLKKVRLWAVKAAAQVAAGSPVTACNKKWAQQDSNLRPGDYESPALTN